MELDLKIYKIHNYIYANEGLSNSETLNEFLKIFYCKILSEQQNDNKTLDELYSKLKIKLKNFISKDEKINLKKETQNFVWNELKDINFTNISSDIKGHILQKIIDRSYRESRGQFFTPSPVVDFMVKMINPQPDEIGCDIACGTGGFMFGALEYSKAPVDNVKFYDISKNLIKLVAMRMMFEFGTDSKNFYEKNSIEQDFDQKFDYIITNPPFGTLGKISDKKILAKYRLGAEFKTQMPDILMVEKVINLLKKGGRAAILLPKGDFENPTLKYFRKYLLENVRIDAVVGLPDKTFTPYGTNVQSGIMFLTKIKPADDYNVYFGNITKLGYTFIKHSKEVFLQNGQLDEDYSKIIKDFKAGQGVSVKRIIENDYNLSTEFFNPKYQKIIDEIKSQKHALLKDLVNFKYKKTNFDKDKTYRYIEITDINPSTDEIYNVSEISGSELPSRASYKLSQGDIIVANSGGSIGTNKHAKAIIDSDFEGCICTNGFTVMHCTKISPYYLLYFFRTKEFLYQILKHKYGSAIPTITKENFENILVPIKNVEIIAEKIHRALELRREAKKIFDTNFC